MAERLMRVTPAPTSVAPPLVRPEATAGLAAALAVLVVAAYGLGPAGLLAGGVAAVLVVLSAIDLRERRLPNRIVLPAGAVALLAHSAVEPSWQWAGAAAGTPVLLALPLLFDRRAIGMGDVKLGILLGATLGTYVVEALLIAFFGVAVLGGVLLLRHGRAARRATVPLGPFLAFGAIAVLLAATP